MRGLRRDHDHERIARVTRPRRGDPGDAGFPKTGAFQGATVIHHGRCRGGEAAHRDLIGGNVKMPEGDADGPGAVRGFEIRHQLPPDTHIVSTVHDELVIETPQETAADVRDLVIQIMKSTMEDLLSQAAPVPVKVEAKICESWGGK